MMYDFQDFSIDLTNAIEAETFDNVKDYYGVIFKSVTEKFKYQIIHNLLMGYRIYIYGEGHLRDMPFHRGTQWFLPEEIKITWKKNETRN